MKSMEENFELLPHCSHMRQFMVFFTCITAKPARKQKVVSIRGRNLHPFTPR